MKKIVLFVLMTFPLFCSAQKRGNVWCFGDSAGIDFNLPNNPLPISTGLRTRGSCCSISDSTGNLLFYANDRANGSAFFRGLVYNSDHSIMPSSDSLACEGWYNEMVIVPFPNNDSLYYLFTIMVLSPYGLYYSVVNMNADSGRGDVIVKNVQLQNDPMVDCLNAIKHGNGRDWWLFFRTYTGFTVGNNEFHSYLISPAGITNYTVQNIGSANRTDLGQVKFNAAGTKMCFNNYRGLLELYGFDRCTGMISNPQNLYPDNGLGPWPSRWSNEFSLSGDYLYLSVMPDSSYLIQYNLNAPNIIASADTLWTTSFPLYCGGALKRAPNSDKIYFSCVYYNGFFPYPYPDSVYNTYNMNLGVINMPDSLGVASDFQPYSFYLGGKRTYWGLPNNPDYDMPALSGSPCDSLTGIVDIGQDISNAELFVFYHSVWQKLFVNAQHIKGKNCLLQIFDINGREVFSSTKKTEPPYFTQDVNVSSFNKGMYLVRLTTEKEKLVKKFVKD